MLTYIILSYVVFSYSFVWGYLKGMNKAENKKWLGIDYDILSFSPITVFLLFIDND